MDGRLAAKAAGRFLAGLALVALLLFVPAGTLRYWNGWLFIGVLFGPMLAAGLVMCFRSPELLRKRLSAREEQPEQRHVIALSALTFVAAFVIAGLNFRFGWLKPPDWLAWAAAVVLLLSYGLYAEVMRENAWLSRTVEVQAGQTVIDTGLYGIVRHPMYSAALLLFLSTPLVLGSPISFVIMLAFIPIFVRRIENEEAVLAEGLEGYAAYRERVKYRLLPGVW